MECSPRNKEVKTTTLFAVSFLVLSIVLAQLGPVFAQTPELLPIETSTPPESTIEEIPQIENQTPEISRETPLEPQENNSIDLGEIGEGEGGMASMQGSALFSQGAASPGPGSVAGSFFNQQQFKIDKNTGAARITYPIGIPPGRNKLQPNLDLVYSSQDSQTGSILGEGWSISIPYIERMNKKGVDTFYATSTDKYFVSSLDGELSTTTVSSSYIARTENGSFNRYTFSGNQWTVTDKQGIRYVFGSSTDSQQTDPGNASNTYKWMLSDVVDTSSNTITYAYFKDGGQIYPSSTFYTGNIGSAGIFQVDFSRIASSDNGTSSVAGFGVKSNYRINEIQAKINGTTIKKYALNYTAGDNGTTTLLRSVTLTGQNASGSINLPTSTFSYRSQTPGWAVNSAWYPLVSFTATSSADNGTRVADVNGDGLPDIVRSQKNATSTYALTYVNNGAGWTVSSTWNAPIAFVSSTADYGVRIADVNGDALPDFIQAYTHSGPTVYSSYLNNGHGWTATTTWNPPMSFVTDGNDTGVRIADVNADGLPDIIQWNSTYINTGSGWATSTIWNPPTVFVSSTLDSGARIVDVNGDGLQDIIRAYSDGSGNHYATYMNTGSGWSSATSSIWQSPVVFISNGADSGARLVDVNGDGLVDILQSSGSAYLNNGAGWITNALWTSPLPFTATGTDNGTRIVDANGDGLADILQAYTDESGAEHFNAYINNNGFRANILTGLTYPQGGSSAISYKSILQITDDLGTVLNGVPYPVYIVSQITTNDGLGNTAASSSYVYYTGTYYTNGPFDHQFAGFNQVRETDGEGNITKTFYHTSEGTDSSKGQTTDNFWKIGKPYRIENYDSSGSLFRVIINKWDTAGLGGNAAFVKIATTTQSDYDGLATHADKAESFTYEDTTGNQIQKIQWGRVTSTDDGSFADNGSDKFVTDITYATSTVGTVGFPSNITVTDQSAAKVKETRFYYDNLSLGNVSTGNLTKQEDWVATSTYVDTESTYNSYGLITQQLDPRNKQTNHTYDSFNLYPATTTNALSQSTSYEYDYSTGQVTRAKDPNGNISQTIYDALGRVLQLRQANPYASSTQSVKIGYVYTDTPNGTVALRSDYLSEVPPGFVDIPRFSTDTGGALGTNLISYYALEDGSDFTSTYNLTNNNSVLFDQGKVNNASDFGEANVSKYLRSSAGLQEAFDSSATEWSVAGWIKMKTEIAAGNNQDWIFQSESLNNNTGADIEYQYNSGSRRLSFNRIRYSVAGDSVNHTITLGTSTWHHVAMTWNGSTMEAWVNGSSVGTVGSSGSGSGGGWNNISFGANTQPSPTDYSNVMIDEFGVWSKKLSNQEIADLYNAGSGQTMTLENPSVDTYTYYDGLGRVIQIRKSSENSNIYKVNDRIYDSAGMVERESLPYFASGTERTAATSTSYLYISYTYDGLGRPITISNSVGTTTNTYANWKSTITDANGNPKDQHVDAYGSLVRVDEYNGTSTYTTRYSYNGLKNLTNITDALGNVRNFTYDGLGRRLTAEDLHNATDTTYGIWTYAYDDAGNLIQTLDPKSQTVNYTYDDLNRISTEDFTGQGGTEYSYGYDSCVQGAGRLCTVTSTDILVSKAYNELGQLIQESKTISSTVYISSYTYDPQGNQLLITNPDNSQIRYTYNTAGLVETVEEKESGAESFTSIISNFDYAPTDQVKLTTYANGLQVKNIYDPRKLYRLTGKMTMMEEDMPLTSGQFSELLPFDYGFGLATTSTITYNTTGSVISYTAPHDVYGITIIANGSQGGNGGGLGGRTSASMSVASGTTYYFSIGDQGGYGGGGSAGGGGGPGAPGGGMTWFGMQNTFSTSSVLIVAGGGGGKGGTGSGNWGSVGDGGGGGGTTGTGGTAGSAAFWPATGGSGGTQSAGGSAGGSNTCGNTSGVGGVAGNAGQGGNGGDGAFNAGGGGGGGGGYYGGGGGGGNGTRDGGCNGGGGGGGSSYILSTSTLTNTSTVSGVNTGDGSLIIIQQHHLILPTITSTSQFYQDATTTLSRGSSTNERSVVFGAMLNTLGSANLRMQVEVQPIGKNFTNIPNVTSSPMGLPNRFATTSFSGTSGVSYHWQARSVDALNNPSDWLRFSSSTFTTDFTFRYLEVTTTSTLTGTSTAYTVPEGVTKLIISAYGAEGGGGGNSVAGGLGGAVTGTLLVTPGTTYYFAVGGRGNDGQLATGTNKYSGGGGGGMTWFGTQNLFSTSTAIFVAAGGGGGGGYRGSGDAGSEITGGFGGFGGGGNGGSYGPTVGVGSGAGGGGYYGGYAATGTPGIGGTQSSGFAPGQGGNGEPKDGTYIGSSNGPGGNGGGLSGENGTWGGNSGSGGGGGSSFIRATSTITNTSTASGVRSGNGYIEIKGLIAPALSFGSLNQYYADATTTIPSGYSTTDGKIVFGGVLNSEGTSSLRMDVQVDLHNSVTMPSFSTDSAGTLASGIKSYWKLEDTSDYVGSSTLTNTNSVSFNSAKVNNGADFGSSNTNKRLRIGSNLGISQGAFSYSMWVKLNTEISSGIYRLFYRDDASLNKIIHSLYYDYNGGTRRLVATRGIDGIVNNDAVYNVTLGTSNWNHIVMTYDGSTLRLYVNEVERASISSSLTSGTGGSWDTFSVGNLDDGAGTSIQYTSGIIDELGVWNKTLSTSEIADLYNAGSGQTMNTPLSTYYSTSSGMVAPGSFATTSYNGVNGAHHWQARIVDPENNNASAWQNFGESSTTNDFYLSPVIFTYPPPGTTTPIFSNWQARAVNVTSSNSYMMRVAWGPNSPTQASSSMTASGTAITSGINIPRTSSTFDYTDTGDSISMIAQAYLYDITGGGNIFIATTSVAYYQETIPTPTTCDNSAIQCISYQYDANGNITKIVENASTSAHRTIDYTYDALNRLTLASSSNVGSGSNYRHTFTYNAIGNMLSGPAGTYGYSHATSSYANPHALLSLGTSTYAYDNNGNLTTSGSSTLTWNYRNQLTQIGSSSYGYDSMGQRVRLVEGATTTIFATPGYNLTPGSSSTIRKSIFANGVLIANVQATGTIRYNLADHLGSTNIVTDDSGNGIETLDYYPFGALRVDVKASGFSGEKRKFIGQYYDEETQLSYLQARYHNSSRGQFISQDPVFLAIGDSNQIQKLVGLPQKVFLQEPQQLNSYSYAINNPITMKDPEGKAALGACGNYSVGGLFYGGGSTCGVIVFSGSPLNVQIGLVGSGDAGATTALVTGGGSGGLLYSNAKDIQDFNGLEVGGEVAWRGGLEIGVGVKTQKPTQDGRRVNTINVNVGGGAAGTPYLVPIEVRGGTSYGKVVWSADGKQLAKNSYDYIQKQIDNLWAQFNALKIIAESNLGKTNSK